MKLNVLILAAGEGSRFGSVKQLALFRGKPLLHHALDLAGHFCDQPGVTVGAHWERIMQAPECSSFKNKCHWIKVDHWQKGMAQSIGSGIKWLYRSRLDASGVLILLADQPLIDVDALGQLVKQIKPGEKQILCARYSRGVGVPAYFSRDYFDALAALEGDRGAKSIIENNPHQIFEIGGVDSDIDTPEDYQALQAGDDKNT